MSIRPPPRSRRAQTRLCPTTLQGDPDDHGDHRPESLSALVQPHLTLRPAQAVGVHAQGGGARARHGQARASTSRRATSRARSFAPRPTSWRRVPRRSPTATCATSPAPACRAARRHRRGGHQARPADGARGGAGDDGREARPDPVAAHGRRPGRRGDLPQPGLPAGRVLDHLRRRHGGVRPAGRARLPLRPRLAAEPDHAQDQDADHQLAPAAQRHDRRPAGRDRGDLRGAQRDRAHRRDLQPHGLRAGRAQDDRRRPGDGRPLDPGRHLLEDLHHDRLPDRLVRGQQGPHHHDGHLPAELGHQRARLRPAGGAGRDHRPPGARRRPSPRASRPSATRPSRP